MNNAEGEDIDDQEEENLMDEEDESDRAFIAPEGYESFDSKAPSSPSSTLSQKECPSKYPRGLDPDAIAKHSRARDASSTVLVDNNYKPLPARWLPNLPSTSSTLGNYTLQLQAQSLFVVVAKVHRGPDELTLNVSLDYLPTGKR